MQYTVILIVRECCICVVAGYRWFAQTNPTLATKQRLPQWRDHHLATVITPRLFDQLCSHLSWTINLDDQGTLSRLYPYTFMVWFYLPGLWNSVFGFLIRRDTRTLLTSQWAPTLRTSRHDHIQVAQHSSSFLLQFRHHSQFLILLCWDHVCDSAVVKHWIFVPVAVFKFKTKSALGNVYFVFGNFHWRRFKSVIFIGKLNIHFLSS